MATTKSIRTDEFAQPQYIIRPKKAIQEYAALDAEDESLARWKRSLGLNLDAAQAVNSIGAPGDKRQLVVLHMKVAVEAHDPVILDFENPKEMLRFQSEAVQVIEKAKFRITFRFRVQHEIVTGLRYYQVAKRSGITFSKTDAVLGSYPPNTKENPYYEVTLPEGEAPGGLMARGAYQCHTSFMDDDKVAHREVPWKLAIVRR